MKRHWLFQHLLRWSYANFPLILLLKLTTHDGMCMLIIGLDIVTVLLKAVSQDSEDMRTSVLIGNAASSSPSRSALLWHLHLAVSSNTRVELFPSLTFLKEFRKGENESPSLGLLAGSLWLLSNSPSHCFARLLTCPTSYAPRKMYILGINPSSYYLTSTYSQWSHIIPGMCDISCNDSS